MSAMERLSFPAYDFDLIFNLYIIFEFVRSVNSSVAQKHAVLSALFWTPSHLETTFPAPKMRSMREITKGVAEILLWPAR